LIFCYESVSQSSTCFHSPGNFQLAWCHKVRYSEKLKYRWLEEPKRGWSSCNITQNDQHSHPRGPGSQLLKTKKLCSGLLCYFLC
jgi:hypothetical protein